MLRWGLIAMTIAAVLLAALATARLDEPDAAAAQRVALQWTGAELTDPPRRTVDGWEVDVRRGDGSLVEIQLGTGLELRALDEERGAGGTSAHDEVTGALRARAIGKARAVSGPGTVRGVERERDGSIEVDIVASGQRIVEVELDGQLRVLDIDEEEIGDE